MRYTDDRLEAIFDTTDGRCSICGGRLCYSNYGLVGARGAWEPDHGNPRSRRGTDRLNNLKPAHIRCNRSRGNRSLRSARSTHGRTRAPSSRASRHRQRTWNALGAAALGGLAGGALGGRRAAIAGAALGGLLGYHADID